MTTRSTQPKLDPTAKLNDQGRSRIALFCNLTAGNARSVRVILDQGRTIAGILEAAARILEEDESLRACVLHATAAILEAGDDQRLAVDRQTMKALKLARKNQADRDTRFDDRVLTLATYATQVALYAEEQERLAQLAAESEITPRRTARMIPLAV